MSLSSGSVGLTAAQEILLAAAKLAAMGREQFTEWDLTVAAWSRNKNRFGCRGYEDLYPDHKRVMSEIMGTTKKENPIRHGWLRRVRSNQYEISPLGLAEADRLQGLAESHQTPRAAQHLYDALSRYVQHDVFRAYQRNHDEPKTWFGAQAFLGMRRLDRMALDDAMDAVELTAKRAVEWMHENAQDVLHSGPKGGGKALLLSDVAQLREFIEILNSRFAAQFEAIRKRG